MIKKLCIGMLLLFGNVYCMEEERVIPEEKTISNSIDIGKNIIIKEMQLYHAKNKENYVILLSDDGTFFIYNGFKISPFQIEISLISLKFISLFKDPIWKHIGAPIVYKGDSYLPIATDNDVFLAKITESTEGELYFNITKKIISHNTNIYTVQSFKNPNDTYRIISSSTYPTTKFWSTNKKDVLPDLPGYLLLGGDTSQLFFLNDNLKDQKWTRWNAARKEKDRIGTLSIKKYDNVDNKDTRENMPIPNIEAYISNSDNDIVFAINNNYSIVKANGLYYWQNNQSYLEEFTMPQEFTKKNRFNFLKQLYITHLTKINNDVYPVETKKIPFVIGVTTTHIYLWQLDLLEFNKKYNLLWEEPKTHLYSVNLNQFFNYEDCKIQKTFFDKTSRTLYIIYTKENTCTISKYNMPTNYSELTDISNLEKIEKAASIENTELTKQSKSDKSKMIKDKDAYAILTFSTYTNPNIFKQTINGIKVETVDKSTNEVIKINIIQSNNVMIPSNLSPSDLYTHLTNQIFRFEKKVSSKISPKQKLYFRSDKNEIVIIHYFKKNDQRNYAEHFTNASQENNTSYLPLKFSVEKNKFNESNTMITVEQENNTQKLKAHLLENKNVKDIENNTFTYSELITEYEFKLIDRVYVNNIIETFIFTDENGNQIHIKNSTYDSHYTTYYIPTAQYFTKASLEQNPLK